MKALRPALFALGASLVLIGCGVQPSAPVSAIAHDPWGPAVRAEDASEIMNFKQVDDRLYRGGLLDEAKLRKLAKMGIKTDICLLFEGNPKEADAVKLERKLCKELGMKFVYLPLPWGKEPPAEMVQTFFKAMEADKNAPAYIHCRHGRDRTGAMVGAYRVQFSGFSPEKAFDEMKTFGFDPAKYPFYATFVQGFKAKKADKKELALL